LRSLYRSLAVDLARLDGLNSDHRAMAGDVHEDRLEQTRLYRTGKQ
jgi:hypothetical protein